MWIMPLGLIALVLWALARPDRRYGRYSGNEPREAHSGDPALEIVRQRFAKGEITEEEYEQLKSKLAR
jgi:uncharacterized membrane protein